MATQSMAGGGAQARANSPVPPSASHNVITPDRVSYLSPGRDSNSVRSDSPSVLSPSMISGRMTSSDSVSTSSSANSSYSESVLSPTSSSRRKSNLDRIKQRLRSSESRLSTSILTSNARLLSGEVKPYENHPEVAGEENQEDAVKALGRATCQLQKQLDRKSRETNSLQDAVDRLEKQLKTKEEERKQMEDDLKIFRRSIDVYSDQIHRLSQELQEKNKLFSSLCGVAEEDKQRIRDLEEKLAAAHQDFEWTREESISKGDQIEYFEYQLLAKNDEIDNMRQELDKKLRRIVELEVDLETLNGASSHVIKDVGQKGARETEVAGDDAEELHLKKKRGAFGKLRGLGRSCHKHEDPDLEWLQTNRPRSRSDISIAEAFPTDNSMTETTVSYMDSSDASPSRDFLSSGRKSRNSERFSCEQHDRVIGRLRSDLASMEARYKRDKYNSMKLIEDMKQKNKEQLIRIACMEKKLQQTNDQDEDLPFDIVRDDFDEIDNISTFEASVKSNETPSEVKIPDLQAFTGHSDSMTLPNKAHYLQQKVTVLENERRFHKALIEDLRARLSATENQARSRENESKRELDELRFDNEAKAAKITELERNSGLWNPSFDSGGRSEFVSSLEARVIKQFADITRLHQENESKDRAIDALRAELVDLRMEKLHGLGDFARSSVDDAGYNGRYNPVLLEPDF